MIGLIRYVSKVATPMRSPYVGIDFYADMAAGWSGDAPAGTVISLLLEMRYTRKDYLREDKRYVNEALSNYRQTIAFPSKNGERIKLIGIKRTKDAEVADDFAAFNALLDHLKAGGVVSWIEDYENYPNDVKNCDARKGVKPMRRLQNFEEFILSVDLWEVSSLVPINIPPLDAPGTL